MKAGRGVAGGPLRLALQAYQAGRLDAAFTECSRILQQNPAQFEALSLAGQICLQQRRIADAIKLLTKAEAVRSGDQRTLTALAQAWLAAGRPQDAARCLDSLCRSRPFERDLWLSAADAWLAAASLNDALALLHEADTATSADPQVLARLAEALRGDGQYAAALVVLERWLAIDPANVPAWCETAELAAAEGLSDRVGLAIDNAEQHSLEQGACAQLRVARTLWRLGRPEDCLVRLKPLLALPEWAQQALSLLCECCVDASNPAALAQLAPAALTTNNLLYLGSHARAALAAGDTFTATTVVGKALRAGLYDHAVMSCRIECQDAVGSADERLAARLQYYGYVFPMAAAQLAVPPLVVTGQRPRIGFVTARHSPGSTGNWQALLDGSLREVFDIYCYVSLPDEGEGECGLRARVDGWRNVEGWSDARLAALIRNDRINILIDCDGHHHRSRLFVFCMKPAPLQITLAAEAGTGMGCFDYRARLQDRQQTVPLPCVEPLLEPVLTAESAAPLLQALWRGWQDQRATLLAAEAKAPDFEQAFAQSSWSAVEQAFRKRSELMGLDGARRFVRAASLVTMGDYCARHGLPYRQVLPAQQTAISLPAFFGFPLPEPASMTIPEVYLAEVRDAVVFADSSAILLPQHEAVLDQALNGGASRFDFRASSVSNVDERSIFVSAPVAGAIRQIERGIFLGGQGAFNYYHWLIEILSRMASVDDAPEYDDWPLLVDSSALAIPQHAELLQKINRSGREIIALLPYLPYSVQHLCVPSHLAWLPCHYRPGQQMQLRDQFLTPTAVDYLRRQLLPASSSVGVYGKGRKRLFIARRATAGYRHLLNEAELEALFIEFGFEPIRPERLSLQQQIELFSQAEVIAGPTGAGMTNILFAPDHAKIICFMPRYLQEFASFSTIAAIRKLPMLFLDGVPLKDSHRIYFQSDFTVDLQQAKALLESFAPYQDAMVAS